MLLTCLPAAIHSSTREGRYLALAAMGYGDGKGSDGKGKGGWNPWYGFLGLPSPKAPTSSTQYMGIVSLNCYNSGPQLWFRL